MSKPPPQDPKTQRLREQGVLHRRADEVSDALFEDVDFFDARDLLQVKYELLRRVAVDHHSVSASADAFGLSRPTYYEIQAAWEREGLAGLLPRKRGPHGGHKLTDEIVSWLLAERAAEPSHSPSTLAELVRERFGVQVHPRSIQRVIERVEKKLR